MVEDAVSATPSAAGRTGAGRPGSRAESIGLAVLSLVVLAVTWRAEYRPLTAG